jgi:hypothetical protein
MDREVDEGLIVRYLLRDSAEVELCEDQFQDIEMRYLADPEFFEQVLAIEDDLIQSYANVELTDEETMRFERLYLDDPTKSGKIRFSRSLSKWVSRNGQQNQIR